MEYAWSVRKASGLTAASGTATTLEEARREAVHYGVQYAQDGPVDVRVRCGRATLLQIRLGETRAALKGLGA